MKVKRILAMFIVMAFSVAVSFVYADEKVDLKLRLEKGQSYKMRTLNEMKIKQTIPGQQGQQQTMTIIEKSGAKNIYTVEDVQADSTLVIKVTYDAISFKQENPTVGWNVEYDSTDTSTAVGPMTPVLGAIVGQSFTITITPDGHVKEVQGIDALWRRMEEKIDELSEEGPERVAMETQMKMQYGEEALKTNTENSFNMYPDNPIGIGDTWQRKTEINQGFPMIVDSIYTLKERKDGIAVIDVFAMIQTNKEVGPMEMSNMKIQYNMSGSVTGIMEMQESTGWVIRSNQNLRLTGSVIVNHPERPQPMSIPMSITGIITQEPY
ncbi:MAG: hypothetical protein KJ887_03170 [Candidatus Omnitrophica bacterium]|nr:hypothetical protein [Candidatus Omnitrophota bacterium]MBU1048277.1 hypothetical protein [Candidatus Omnitrophota bacterium]MBU1630390.1 hypothetical protein [Candidatus Omnitrophota bacterium]MBU1888689.1 hypothetical protein [Candidatus Omnitrophota bacterium]